MRFGLSFSWLFAGILLAPTAVAERASAALDVELSPQTEQCMNAAAVERAVEARLRRRIFVPAADADLRVQLRYERAGKVWRARLTLHNRSGELLGRRELNTEAAHCSSLDASVALVVALLVDVSREQAVPDEVLPEPAVRPTPLQVPQNEHAPREPWRFEPAVLGAVAFGLLPNTALGVRLRLGIEAPFFWPTEFELSFWGSSAAEVESARVSFSLASVGLFICPVVFEIAPGDVALCAGQHVARVQVEPFGFDENFEHTRIAYSVGARVQGGLPLGKWWRARVGVGAEAVLSRDQFFFTRRDGTQEDIFQMAPAILTIEAGLGVRF